mmetsp:Transcript_23158/g.54675  ORF Transcript_23158/g.54675 Transcript_23158/m.54675 type:complete len:93 (+) Transcript_23158:175-453(+)
MISSHLIQSWESTPSGERAQDGVTTMSFKAGIHVWFDDLRIQALQVGVLALPFPVSTETSVDSVISSVSCKNASPIGLDASDAGIPTKTSAT